MIATLVIVLLTFSRQQRDRCDDGKRDDGEDDAVLGHRLPLLVAAKGLKHGFTPPCWHL
jgi:hypothetical protein